MSNESNLERVRFLEGERVFLTPLSKQDIDLNYAWDLSAEMQYLDGWRYDPKYRETYEDEFDGAFKSKTTICFSAILKDSGELIGAVVIFGISERDRVCSWGLKIDPKHWKNGLGKEVGRLVMAYVFETLGFEKLKSGTHSKNPGSQRLQESLGMTREGVGRAERYLKGEYIDNISYGMLRSEYFEKYGRK